MYLRIDKLQIDLPMPEQPDPNAASAVQELMGGRFGEMSTLMNYTYQSFNFRGRSKIRPYYDLIANIATEELGHIELVSATVNAMLSESQKHGDPTTTPMNGATNLRNLHHFIATGQGIQPGNSMGGHWNGDYVFSSGNLKLDLLHNFFLEVGARTQKLRVYEMTDHPVAREMLGYLLVRGGVHAHAYAKALETLTGVEVEKMLPIPEIEDKAIPEARKYEDAGYHRILYRFSYDDFQEASKIWNGPSPDGSGDREVRDGAPEGSKERPDFPEAPESFAPHVNPEDLAEIARKLDS